ncbi:hypothetical protein GV827_19395 [Sulfitobacter sp. JBTF-M27]|uniref:Hedgehog/Intein (Hint) domain-containing protein n=1 Tax=Sulfitobacter sediminilitoris TaxID=2698830 RepID=A0A6P0CGQ0_9RHOB|nr:Hint domain-containing protein [Sulfitobacter sediminilitoris]NEK24550.1 hypothetical protein [Sulfitobacter sediminilitoris]
MATFNYSGYDDDQITWPGGTVSNGDTITFTQPTDHTISITDNDSTLVDGTDDRDDEDTSQTAIVYDEFGAVETSGQIQPRNEITLNDGTNTYYMTEVYIAATNSYYYIFQDPAPSLNVEYTVTNVSSPNSTTYAELSEPGIVCFTSGTLIATPQGDCRVEDLQPGDMVMTLDRGAQSILWIGQRRVSWHEMKQRKGMRPFLVRAHTFGPAYLARDTLFPRQHRILITEGMVHHQAVSSAGVLAPVHTLTNVPGIEEQCPPGGVTYFHILTRNHNLLWSNGVATESFLVTEYSSTLAKGAANAIVHCPSEIGLAKMDPARPILQNRLAREVALTVQAPDGFEEAATGT